MSHRAILADCPHCGLLVFVCIKDFNCRIFRHGVYKHSMKQIDPHLPKKECDRLKVQDLIIGCGKPFKLINDMSGKTIAVKCDYI